MGRAINSLALTDFASDAIVDLLNFLYVHSGRDYVSQAAIDLIKSDSPKFRRDQSR